MFTDGRERGLAEPWEKLLLDRGKEVAVVKKFGDDVCLFPLIPSSSGDVGELVLIYG